MDQETYWLAAQNLERLKYRYWCEAKFAYGQQLADELFPDVVKFEPIEGEEPLTDLEVMQQAYEERSGKPLEYRSYKEKTTSTLRPRPVKKGFIASIRSFLKVFKGSGWRD